ncbi:MAG: acyl-CoA thioesterase [Sedimentisphaerales bacterium]|nr:acyl-CoA thioesterase [Sedimentisphaerales bacterium]
MFKMIIEPRFGDADGLGHINNTVLPAWFEQGRNPIYRLFTPDLKLEQWELTMAKMEVEFIGELQYGKEVEIRSYLLEIGNSSMTIGQEAWQDDKLGVKGKTIIVHYDFNQQKSVPIPKSIKNELEKHLIKGTKEHED